MPSEPSDPSAPFGRARSGNGNLTGHDFGSSHRNRSRTTFVARKLGQILPVRTENPIDHDNEPIPP
jgi:hypothetical protein